MLYDDIAFASVTFHGIVYIQTGLGIIAFLKQNPGISVQIGGEDEGKCI